MEDFLALMSKIKGMKFKSLKQTRQRKAQNDRIRSATIKVKILLDFELRNSKNPKWNVRIFKFHYSYSIMLYQFGIFDLVVFRFNDFGVDIVIDRFPLRMTMA